LWTSRHGDATVATCVCCNVIPVYKNDFDYRHSMPMGKDDDIKELYIVCFHCYMESRGIGLSRYRKDCAYGADTVTNLNKYNRLSTQDVIMLFTWSNVDVDPDVSKSYMIDTLNATMSFNYMISKMIEGFESNHLRSFCRANYITFDETSNRMGLLAAILNHNGPIRFHFSIMRNRISFYGE
jgi:hypothetical protein